VGRAPYQGLLNRQIHEHQIPKAYRTVVTILHMVRGEPPSPVQKSRSIANSAVSITTIVPGRSAIAGPLVGDCLKSSGKLVPRPSSKSTVTYQSPTLRSSDKALRSASLCDTRRLNASAPPPPHTPLDRPDGISASRRSQWWRSLR